MITPDSIPTKINFFSSFQYPATDQIFQNIKISNISADMPSCQWRGDRGLGSCVPLHICSYPGRSSLSSILWSSYHGRSTLSLSYHHQHYQHHHHTRGHNLEYEALGDLPFAEISWSSILNDIIMIWPPMSLDRRPWAKPSRASSPSSCLSR